MSSTMRMTEEFLIPEGMLQYQEHLISLRLSSYAGLEEALGVSFPPTTEIHQIHRCAALSVQSHCNRRFIIGVVTTGCRVARNRAFIVVGAVHNDYCAAVCFTISRNVSACLFNRLA